MDNMKEIKLEFCALNYLKGNDNGTTRDYISVTLSNGKRLVLYVDETRILFNNDVEMVTL